MRTDRNWVTDKEVDGVIRMVSTFLSIHSCFYGWHGTTIMF